MKKNLKTYKPSSYTLKWLVPPAVGILTALSLSSCTKSATEKANVISESDIQLEVDQAKIDRANGQTEQADAKLRSAAEKYARMGELMLTPDGFQYADEMFGKALEADPNNRKANFYKAVTEPAMLAKGFVPRIERLITTQNEMTGLEEIRQNIAQFEMPELTQFSNTLAPGEKAFISYYDVQRFERERVLPALVAALARLDKIDVSSSPLQLNIVPERLSPDPVRRESSYHYQSHWCDNYSGSWKCQDYTYYNDNRGQKPLDRVYFVDKHDLKLIRSSYMAMIAGLRVATAYSQKDVEFLIRRLKALDHMRHRTAHGHISAEDIVRVTREFPDFMTLESDNQLSEVAKVSTEALKNMLDLNDLSDQICSGGRNGARNKKTAVFFPICLTLEEVKAAKMGVDMLAGPKEVVLGTTYSGKNVTIMVDITQLLKNPQKDLKALLPTTFDENGEPENYPDPTMGGVFPKGDLIEKLKTISKNPMSYTDRQMGDVSKFLSDLKDRI